MSSFEEFEKFLQMDAEERQQHINDMLANIAEPWLNTPEEPMVLALVGSIRAFMDGVNQYATARDEGGDAGNPYVLGVFMHSYQQQVRNFQTVVALSDMKRSLG